MKSILLLLALSITLMTTGCYSNSTKSSDTDSPDQTTSKPSHSGRY